VLSVEELTILTSWAEALAEVVFAGSERLETCLADAFAGAPWRSNLGFLSRHPAFAPLSPRSATLPGGPPLPTRSQP